MPSNREAFLDETRRVLEEARARYRLAIASALGEAQVLATIFEPAIGDLSAGEALDAWRREMITELQRALAAEEELCP